MNSLRHRFSIRTQLLALFGVLLFAGATVLVLDELALHAEIRAFNTLRDESLTGLRLAKSISDAYGLEIVDTTFRVRNYLMGWDQGAAVVETAEGDIERDWRNLLASNLSLEQRALTDEVAKARIAADQAAQKLHTILQAQDIVALGKFADTELYPAMDPVTTRLQFLADVKMLDAERVAREHLAHARTIDWWRIALSVVALLFVLIVGRGILLNVYKGIGRLVHLARHARDPDFIVSERRYDPESEFGQIHNALIAMRSDLLSYENSLIESETRAHAASRAKSSFLASMSHEIRTPMVGVAGMLELLAQTKLDADQRQQVEIVQNSATSLLQIIGDILDFSKIEAGKLDLNPAPVDLRQLVRASTNNFLATASGKAIKLDCSIDERVAPAHLADALRLRQILSNFLSNALKFTDRGEVQVRLERLAGEGQRELLALRVRDTGIGISADDQARLFQPFAQTSDGGSRHEGSTGLGLTICRHLAELMGGEITLESRLGIGTTLSLVVRLPLADAASLTHTPTAATPATRSAPSVVDAEREGSLVLMVDDHPTNRAVIARQIRQLGYACETANDGEAGLQLWKSGRFALLLTDLHMPRRDGYALAEAIRSEERNHGRTHAPIIAMSANVSTEEVERSRSAGIDDFLAKPTPLALLNTTLQRYLPLSRFATARPVDSTAVAINVPASVLAELSGDNLARQRDLLEDFMHSARQDLNALQAAFASSDAAAVAHESHRIKGACGLVGATAAAVCATRIEAAAGVHKLDSASADLALLETELQRFAAMHGVELPG